MTIEDKLRNCIRVRFGTSARFCEASGLKKSTLSTILKKGIMNTTTDKLFAICRTLNISADALLEGNIIPRNTKDREMNHRMDKFSRLNDHSKGLIDIVLDYELGEPVEEEPEEPLMAASGGENASEEEFEEARRLARRLRRSSGNMPD